MEEENKSNEEILVSQEENTVTERPEIVEEKEIKEKPVRKDKKSSKISKLQIIFSIIALVFMWLIARFYNSIIETNIIPTKYIVVFAIIELIIILPIIIGLIKRHKTITSNVLCLILIIIISVGHVWGTYHIDATLKFFGKFFKEVQEVEEYYVVVYKDSSYNSLEDIKGKGIYSFQIEENIKQKIKNEATVTVLTSEDLIGLGNSVLNKEIEIAIFSSSQYNMLKEQIQGFEENTKIINKQTHAIEIQKPIEDENTKYQMNNGIFNIYISGIDTYGSINKVSRSDANIIATVNLNTHEVLLTSIPRDYYVTLHSKKAKDKLTHSGIYGISETIATVEDFMGIEINYYIRVNFTTLMKLVDTIGGIDVYSEYSFSPGKYNFVKGYNHLNGEEALIFSRDRFEIKGGDNERIKNQQRVLEAIINKTLNSRTILTKYTDILESLANCFHTNIDQDDVTALVKEQLEKMPSWEIKNNSLTGTGTYSSTYSMGSQQLYVMIPNQNSINKAKQLIQEVMGE